MRFSAFIKTHIDEIVSDWESFARTLPSAQSMSTLALRDHSREILLALARDMASPLSNEARAEQASQFVPPSGEATSAAGEHGALRHMAGFDQTQLFAEFRALRASVMASWRRSEAATSGRRALDEVIRFNEGMDKVVAESVERYSREMGASRDMFLAVLGHDLRGPLSGINLSTRVLAQPELTDTARQRAATNIRRATTEMGSLVTDLLDYTRTRLGAGIPIERTPCDLGPVCEASLEAIRAVCPDQSFVNRMSGDLVVPADAARIRQALSNLLSNAVQHGDREAPVTLSAEGEADAVVLRVTNLGEPIPAEALPALFEPLVQGPAAASEDGYERSKTSLGLGLFIVREIVLGHGGTIEVASSLEHGTVFTLRLPRANG